VPLSDSQIDGAILSVAETSWRKVALVIGRVQRTLDKDFSQGDAGLNLIAERIEALVHERHLLAQGDLKKWRYSEVRKPG
jgi:hypothetical protein